MLETIVKENYYFSRFLKGDEGYSPRPIIYLPQQFPLAKRESKGIFYPIKIFEESPIVRLLSDELYRKAAGMEKSIEIGKFENLAGRLKGLDYFQIRASVSRYLEKEGMDVFVKKDDRKVKIEITFDPLFGIQVAKIPVIDQRTCEMYGIGDETWGVLKILHFV